MSQRDRQCHDCAMIEPRDIVEIYREGRERFPSGLIRTMCGPQRRTPPGQPLAAPIHHCGKHLQNESERAMTRKVDIDIANPDETIWQAAPSGCARVPGAKSLLKFRSRS